MSTGKKIGPGDFRGLTRLLRDGDVARVATEFSQWDLDSKGGDGVALIHRLVHYAFSLERWRLFLSHKVDVNAVSGYGGVPLVMVCEYQCLNLDLIRLFVEHGADPNLYDADRNANALDMVLRCASDPKWRDVLSSEEGREEVEEMGWELSFDPVIEYLTSVGAVRSAPKDLSAERGQYELEQWSTPWMACLVQVDAKGVADAMKRLRGASAIESVEAGENDIRASVLPEGADPVIAVQLKGHSWSQLVSSSEFTLEDAQALSKELGASAVVWMVYDDTSECIGWRVLEQGKVTEELDTGIGMDLKARFKSSRRKKRVRSFRDPEAMWTFIDQSLRDLDALLVHAQLNYDKSANAWVVTGPFAKSNVGSAYVVG